MKKINYSLFVLLALFNMAACDTDNDSNPVLRDATEFVLNVPPYTTSIYDLEYSETVGLTCSQPNYGFPLAVIYSVQISLTGEFINANGDVPATYAVLPTTFTNTRINVDALEIATAIVGLSGIYDEAEFNEKYKNPVKLYIRLHAALPNGMKPIVSNVIEIPKVQAYFALSPVELPTTMFITGTFTNWDWSKALEMVPVNGNPGKFWRVVYFDKDALLKFNSVKDWNGTEFGFANTNFPNGEYADVAENEGNIKIGKAGWYIVVVTAEANGRDLINTVDFLAPNVYLTGDVSGGWDVFDEARLFTVPASSEDEFVSPPFLANDMLRICIKLDNIDWWRTEFIIRNGIIEYRGNGGDQEPRVNVRVGQKAHLKFMTNEGSIK